MNANVATLKQQLEQLFPGKWLKGGDGDRVLRTGIKEIDSGIVSGFARRRISEWSGPSSSGKLTLLRGAVAHWCTSGLNVAYVDTFSRLVAADWAFVQEGCGGAMPLDMVPRKNNLSLLPGNSIKAPGQFFVVRVSEAVNSSRKNVRQEACWVAEQLVRSAIFDAVIFDLGDSSFLPDRTYARLQRALDRSKAALVVVKDDYRNTQREPADKNNNDIAGGGWGCQLSMRFKWTEPVHCEEGMHGVAAILPAVQGVIARDGLIQNMEARLSTHVPNRLFTHPQIPDRRTPKA